MKFKQDDWVYYKGRKAVVNQTMIGAYNKPVYKVYFPFENIVIDFVDEKELSYE